MTDGENDELILEQFRKWLQETRREAANVEEVPGGIPPPPGFGLNRITEEFTALRHELKLQTRSSRALEERLEASLKSLSDATATFQSAAADEVSLASQTAGKQFALALAELDDALERSYEQWKKNLARLSGPSPTIVQTRLDELYRSQPWWRRLFSRGHHRLVRQEMERAEDQSRKEREALLTALLSGHELIQQRLTRTMANAGVARIPTIGRPVDPEVMVVVEVADGPGEPGHVVEEIRRGYAWNGGLLRPAEVRAIRPRYNEENKE